MILKKTIYTILLFLTCSIAGYSQSPSEVNKFKNIFDLSEPEPDYSYAKSNKNEIEQILSISFLFYKSFISSQDAVSCSFHPSCSVYALISIKEKGIFWGVLNAIDRLTRCNGFSPEKYDIHSDTQLLYDPVK